MRSKKKLNTRNLLDLNPCVDKRQFNEARKMVKELRDIGINGAHYNLQVPYSDGINRKKGEANLPISHIKP